MDQYINLVDIMEGETKSNEPKTALMVLDVEFCDSGARVGWYYGVDVATCRAGLITRSPQLQASGKIARCTCNLCNLFQPPIPARLVGQQQRTENQPGNHHLHPNFCKSLDHQYGELSSSILSIWSSLRLLEIAMATGLMPIGSGTGEVSWVRAAPS